MSLEVRFAKPETNNFVKENISIKLCEETLNYFSIKGVDFTAQLVHYPPAPGCLVDVFVLDDLRNLRLSLELGFSQAHIKHRDLMKEINKYGCITLVAGEKIEVKAKKGLSRLKPVAEISFLSQVTSYLHILY